VAIDLNNNVWVFGYNGDGQLGLSDRKKRVNRTKIPSWGVNLHYLQAKFVAVGSFYTMIIDFNDSLWVN
jgi:alpha-tubulin suppressor-like RCC1 family protein